MFSPERSRQESYMDPLLPPPPLHHHTSRESERVLRVASLNPSLSLGLVTLRLHFLQIFKSIFFRRRPTIKILETTRSCVRELSVTCETSCGHVIQRNSRGYQVPGDGFLLHAPIHSPTNPQFTDQGPVACF